MDVAAADSITERALEIEIIALYPDLVRRLTLVLHDIHDAEDVAQSAVARALESRRRFDGRNLRGWLFTIGVRLAFNERRRQRRASRPLEVRGVDWISSDPDLWAALAELEAQPRAALILSVLDGYTHEEIAAILNVRPGTVSSWLSRAKARLRVLLGEE
jgi:RNA polymerase sigma-70 factor (ECF subfamily)